jgi:hypothetical protein
MRHVNPWNKVGTLECEWKLNPDNICTEVEPGIVVTTPSGKLYIFSTETGKIYERNAGVCNVVATSDQAHRGAAYHDGFIFFVTANGTVGYYNITKNEFTLKHGVISNSGFTQSNYTVIYPDWDKVWFGVGADIHNLEITNVAGSGRTPSALVKTGANLPLSWTVTDITKLDDDIIWGSFANNAGAVGQYRRFADSFHSVDDMDGVVDTFFGSSNSNVKFAIAGHEGDIHHITGGQTVLRYRVPCVNTFPNPYLDDVIDGRSIIAIGGRIYSYHQRLSGHPFGLVHSYTCTGGDDATITSISVQENPIGPDALFVSWFDSSGNSGLDQIDYTERAEGLIVTPIVEWTQESSHDERNAKAMVEPKYGIDVHFHSMPENADVEIYYGVNHKIDEYIEAIQCDGPIQPDLLKNGQSCINYERMKVNVDKMPTMVYENPKTGEKVKQRVRMVQGHIVLKPDKEKSPVIRGVELY